MAEKIGKYTVVRTLGKGTTSTVYLAKDTKTKREVAAKVIRFGEENAMVSRRLKKLFHSEGIIGRNLHHPNIVEIYDAVVENDRAFLVMEYVNGKGLDYYSAINRLLPLHRVIGIIIKCCIALDYAHKRGVVHRDIKPANILIDVDDNPKITDFGLALNLHKNKSHDSTFIMGVGSPAYMSPEQIKDHPLNCKTDLYSLGVVLFQLLTGRLPFRANNKAALAYKIVNTDTPSVCALNPNLPPKLDIIIKKALAKDLYSRYGNGIEFAKDLSLVRYQIQDDEITLEQNDKRFDRLRGLAFFVEFDDVELWEILRVSVWRELRSNLQIIKEGDKNQLFGVIVKGLVEVSIEGKSIDKLGAGEVVGEMAYLSSLDHDRSATVVTLEPTTFLEINNAALDLSSEELLSRVNRALVAKVVERLRKANKTLSTFIDQPAIEGASAGAGLDFELIPI